jgi:hypothetical protein
MLAFYPKPRLAALILVALQTVSRCAHSTGKDHARLNDGSGSEAFQ